jgi:4-diphosphocytidyl-2-C-methyl-D-erythritol kinase
MGYWWDFSPFELDKNRFSMHNARMSHAQHAQHPGMCFIRAYAKINLTLDVLGRRADGYHELRTVMQAIDLYDTLCLVESMDGSVHIVCDRPELNDSGNLAVRAAQLVRQRLDIRQGLVLELHKRIPMAAGLGGGSSDAAAVLLALQKWWRLPLSAAELLEMAADLGSDVPFFLSGGLALCEGRGERVTPLAPRWPGSMRWLVLVKPAIAVSTAAVFGNLPASDYSDGSSSRALCSTLEEGDELALEALHNSLERSVLERYPEVARARNELLKAGASLVRLSGSGPTLFAPFSELREAIKVQQEMLLRGYEVYLSRAIYPTTGDICQF